MEKVLRILADDRDMRPRSKVSLVIVKWCSGPRVRQIDAEPDVLTRAQGLVRSEGHAHASCRAGPGGLRIERNRGAPRALHVHTERLDVVPCADRREVGKHAVIASVRENMTDTEYVAVDDRGVNVIKI